MATDTAIHQIGPVRAAAFPPAGAGFTMLLMGIAALLIGVSAQLLTASGLNYEEAGGSALEKIHPGTLVTVVTFVFAMLATGRPLAVVDRLLGEQRAVLLYVGAVLLLMAHAMLVVKLPFTAPIDTFLLPALLYLMLVDCPEGRARAIALVVHAGLIGNALLGLSEVTFSFRLVPFTAGGVPIEDDWRATALLGHPLANASMTGAYVLALAAGGGRDLPRLLRPIAFAIAFLSLSAFGGRTALVLCIAMLALMVSKRVGQFLLGGRVGIAGLLAAIIAVPLIAVGLAVLASTGFFDRFAERFVDDLGSADTRIDMFALFKDLTWNDVLFGPDAAYIDTLRFRLGLEFGIESFWIAFILTYGVVVSVPVFAALIAFCCQIAWASRSSSWAVIGYFFLVASTSVSLSAKGTVFAVLVLMVMTLLRKYPSRRPPLDARPRSF